MIQEIIILGSTGSIGETTLQIIRKNRKKFKVDLITTNKNIKKLYNQAIEFNVKKVVINDLSKLGKYQNLFKKKKVEIFNTVKQALKREKKKKYFTISAISGLDGLEPTLEVIKNSKYLAIANKESIICGWKFIHKELKKHKTNFIPLDSEHFSIWSLLKNENIKNINKIYLTASGGPFLNRKLNDIKNIKPKDALKHPNWKMGKKISIDSATMMNKIFEIIEATKIFNLSSDSFKILIHPKSYVHAIIHFNNGLTKMLAHDTTMEIPITNSLFRNNDTIVYSKKEFNFLRLNGENFIKPSKKKFPLLEILNYKLKGTYFEVILVSLNDALVNLYLNNIISYISIHDLMIKLLKKSYFVRYYDTYPKNINDIRNMVKKVNKYIERYFKL